MNVLDSFSNRVLITPENAVLYNHLLEHETYIGESNSGLIMYSTYEDKDYIVVASKYYDVFIVTSIYNNSDHKECLL